MLIQYCNICGEPILHQPDIVCEDCKKAILLIKDNYDVIKSFIDSLKQPIIINNPYAGKSPTGDNYFIPVSQTPKASIEKVSEINFYDSKSFSGDEDNE